MFCQLVGALVLFVQEVNQSDKCSTQTATGSTFYRFEHPATLFTQLGGSQVEVLNSEFVCFVFGRVKGCKGLVKT